MSYPAVSELGLCSWSLQATDIDDLIAKVQKAGINAVQLALEPLRSDLDNWANAKAKLADAGIKIQSGMYEPVGENYTTPQTIRETGGIIPDKTWDENWQRIEQVVLLAAEMGIEIVTLHAGFIPEDKNDPKYSVMVNRLRMIADRFADAYGGTVLLETGQETADDLVDFLKAVSRPNLGANFDPANMLLYNMDEPIEALNKLLSYVKQVHLKDANRPAESGQWGEEVVVGTGQVNWKKFLKTLKESSFSGNLVVEREAGDDRVGDICKAVEFISQLSQEI